MLLPICRFLRPRTIESLSQFDPGRVPSEPVKLSGRVLSRRHDSVLLQDSTGGIVVDLQPRQKCGPGDRVDVEGFLIHRANGWALEDGLSRVLATPVDAPGPVDVTPSEAASGAYAATLIRVEAVLLEQFAAGDSDHVFLLQSKEQPGSPRLMFPAILPREQVTNELLELKPGAHLRVSGACGMPYDRSMIASFRVLLRNADDVEVMERPPWWTRQKALALAGAIAALALVACAWVARCADGSAGKPSRFGGGWNGKPISKPIIAICSSRPAMRCLHSMQPAASLRSIAPAKCSLDSTKACHSWLLFRRSPRMSRGN